MHTLATRPESTLRPNRKPDRRPPASARAWKLLNAPAGGRRVPGTSAVFLAGLTIGLVASVFSIRTGHALDYPDAMSRLTIARRILDSDDPGTQQLGTVWPPFPHLLLMPWVQSLWLWKTGVAGAIVSILALAAASASLYRILARLAADGWGRLVGLLLLWANPSYLYLCTTALTEPVLIATVLATIAGLVRWATSRRRLSGGELSVFAGVPAAMGVLTRYEAWALTLAGFCFVLVVSWQRGLPCRRGLALAMSFLAPAVAAVISWLAYNYAMYGDLLDFARGPYSAAEFNKQFREQGLLFTEGNLGLTLRTYVVGTVEIVGIFPLLLAALALVTITVAWGVDHRALTVWIAGVPTFFLVYGLFAGQHIMMNAGSVPPGIFNNRQAVSTLPWVAIIVGLGTTMGVALLRPYLPRFGPAALTGALVLGIVLQNAWWAQDYYHRNAVLTEAINDRSGNADLWAAAEWLRLNYDGGKLLVDETAVAGAPLFGLPLSDHLNRADGPAFEQAVANPSPHARWIIMHGPASLGSGRPVQDAVTRAVLKNPGLLLPYGKAFEDGDLVVYRRLGG